MNFVTWSQKAYPSSIQVLFLTFGVWSNALHAYHVGVLAALNLSIVIFLDLKDRIGTFKFHRCGYFCIHSSLVALFDDKHQIVNCILILNPFLHSLRLLCFALLRLLHFTICHQLIITFCLNSMSHPKMNCAGKYGLMEG